jgi:histone H3/H4
MEKNKTSANRLIKRNQLIKFLKEKGINRTNTKALEEIQKKIFKYLTILTDQAKENMITHGRNTLIREDVIKENHQEEYEI